MTRKTKIIIIVVVAVIILTIAGILIYKNYFSKKAKAQKESEKLLEQLNNPLLTPQQRQSVQQQIDLLAGIISGDGGDGGNGNTNTNTNPLSLGGNTTVPIIPASTGSGCKKVSFPAKRGMCGAEVKKIQKYLNTKIPSACREKVKSILPLVEDGIFGAKTETVYKTCYGDLAVEQSVYSSMASVV